MSVRSLRRGSIAASRVQAPSTVTVLSLPGTSGNYASTPDSVANSITGAIDIRMHVAMADWTTPGYNALITKWLSPSQQSWFVGLTGDMNFIFLKTSGGSDATFQSGTSTVPATLVGGTDTWLRWTFSGTEYRFYVSADGASWTQVGDPVAGSGAIFNSSTPVAIGSLGDGTQVKPGTFYYAEIRDGIGGTVVAKFDPSAVTILGTRNPTTAVASTGETWTVNGSAWDWATV